MRNSHIITLQLYVTDMKLRNPRYLALTLFLLRSPSPSSMPCLIPGLPWVSWQVQPGKFINLYSMPLAVKRRVPKKKINFPVLDLGFHPFSLSPSLSLSPLFSFTLSFCCPTLLPWNWGKISEKLRTRCWEMAKGHKGERFWMRGLACVWMSVV